MLQQIKTDIKNKLSQYELYDFDVNLSGNELEDGTVELSNRSEVEFLELCKERLIKSLNEDTYFLEFSTLKGFYIQDEDKMERLNKIAIKLIERV